MGEPPFILRWDPKPTRVNVRTFFSRTGNRTRVAASMSGYYRTKGLPNHMTMANESAYLVPYSSPISNRTVVANCAFYDFGSQCGFSVTRCANFSRICNKLAIV